MINIEWMQSEHWIGRMYRPSFIHLLLNQRFLSSPLLLLFLLFPLFLLPLLQLQIQQVLLTNSPQMSLPNCWSCQPIPKHFISPPKTFGSGKLSDDEVTRLGSFRKDTRFSSTLEVNNPPKPQPRRSSSKKLSFSRLPYAEQKCALHQNSAHKNSACFKQLQLPCPVYWPVNQALTFWLWSILGRGRGSFTAFLNARIMKNFCVKRRVDRQITLKCCKFINTVLRSFS